MDRAVSKFVAPLMTEQQKGNRMDTCLELLETANEDETFRQKKHITQTSYWDWDKIRTKIKLDS